MVCKGNLFAHNYLKSTPQILFILTNQHIALSANELTSLLFQEAPQISRCFYAARFSRGRAAAVEPGTGESHYRNGLWLLAGGKPRMSLQVTPPCCLAIGASVTEQALSSGEGMPAPAGNTT